MDPETNSLVAVLVAVGALLTVGVTAGVTLLAMRAARGAATARERLLLQTSTLRSDGPELRSRIEDAAARVDRIREQWAATDMVVTDLTVTMASTRGSLEGLTRGPFAMLIRGAGVVSKAAQLALLWR